MTLGRVIFLESPSAVLHGASLDPEDNDYLQKLNNRCQAPYKVEVRISSKNE